tara:strand:+ start:1979 stop:3772 length:1794 start_codon:yes stop_codon:yes gene_type:complete
MKRLVFDIETDDLYATKIWCLVAKDVEDGKVYSYGPDQIDEGCQLLCDADELIGHNIIGFDLPVIRDLTRFKTIGSGQKIVDTLVLSRLFDPTREAGHGLTPWGFRLKSNKIEFNDFSGGFTQEMMDYCIQDVELNAKVYEALKEESKGFSRECVDLEHRVTEILKEQEAHGFLYDAMGADLLLAELRETIAKTEAKVKAVFKPKVTRTKLYPRLTKTGKLSKMADECHYKSGSGVRLSESEHELLTYKMGKVNQDISSCDPVVRRRTKDFNLGSRQQIGEYLQEFGWNPTEYTAHGRPIVNEKTLAEVKGIPEADLINAYLMYQKRVSQINSWNEAVQDDGRIHGFVISNGAVTGRMSHRSPNAAQVPNSSSPYGSRCRSLWTVPDGYNLVGIDASGLELRMLAHFMNDKEYTNDILNGDIHTTNQKLAGLESRDQAKTFIYALLYGAGNEKLALVVGGNKQDGSRLRESFLNNLPSFATLKEQVARASERGYLKGLDGRKLFVRSEHSALNTLLQGAGAIVMKKALVILDDYIKDLDAHFVANVHDEWQIEVREDQSEKVGEYGVKAIREAGEYFNLNCPLDGEYNVGKNWSETH